MNLYYQKMEPKWTMCQHFCLLFVAVCSSLQRCSKLFPALYFFVFFFDGLTREKDLKGIGRQWKTSTAVSFVFFALKNKEIVNRLTCAGTTAQHEILRTTISSRFKYLQTLHKAIYRDVHYLNP